MDGGFARVPKTGTPDPRVRRSPGAAHRPSRRRAGTNRAVDVDGRRPVAGAAPHGVGGGRRGSLRRLTHGRDRSAFTPWRPTTPGDRRPGPAAAGGGREPCPVKGGPRRSAPTPYGKGAGSVVNRCGGLAGSAGGRRAVRPSEGLGVTGTPGSESPPSSCTTTATSWQAPRTGTRSAITTRRGWSSPSRSPTGGHRAGPAGRDRGAAGDATRAAPRSRRISAAAERAGPFGDGFSGRNDGRNDVFSSRRTRAGRPACTRSSSPSTTTGSSSCPSGCARRRPRNKLGFALQLCVLRHPGRLLAPGEFVPPAVVGFIDRQLNLDGDELADYAVRSETRHEHLAELRRLYGFRSFSGGAARELVERLRDEAEQAQSNEDLVRRFVESCRDTRTILPATTTIERLCADVLVDAERASPSGSRPGLPARPRASARRDGRRRRDAVRLARPLPQTTRC